MADAPVHAKVDCVDGECGESINLIVNPATRRVTHIVVREGDKKDAPTRLVPIDQVARATRDWISLRCTKAELAHFEPFAAREHRLVSHADYNHAPYDPTGMLIGNVPTESYYIDDRVEHVPEGEIVVSAGTKVQAEDGEVGHVVDLIIDPKNSEVTHFVLHHSRRMAKDDEITLPLSAIAYVAEDTVYLKLNKEALEKLPAVPARATRGAWQGADIELVGVVYDDPTGADEGLKLAVDLHHRDVFKIRSAAVLAKDPDGKITIKERHDIDPRSGAKAGAVLGGVAGLLTAGLGLVVGVAAGAAAGAIGGKVIDRGFSDNFLKSLAERLQPGKSGLLLIVQHEWVTPVREALAGEKGIILQQTLTDQLVAELTGEASEGSASAP